MKETMETRNANTQAAGRRIALFKPLNAQQGNAFYGGQHSVFLRLKEKYGYQITYFLDSKTGFPGVDVVALHPNRSVTFLLKVLRRIFSWIHYWKVPYYGTIDFSAYDVVVTEGLHYAIIAYCKHVAQKTILNDSISSNAASFSHKIRYVNRYFAKSLAMVVNEKIPLLYQQNGVLLQTEVIGHAVDIEKIPFLQRTHCSGKLVAVGRLSSEKGFPEIIQAVSLLTKRYPGITLDIYGDGPLRQQLERRIAQNGLQNSIFIKGSLDRDALLRQLAQYDVFVSHPLAVGFIAEAFSMANMEAMASGLPVITANCGGVPYVVNNKAVVVEQKDISGLAQAIATFMDSPDMVARYSLDGRRYVEEHFSLDTITDRWHAAITRLLGAH